ncbi:unnamed protein product [Caenorhabditis brenneri]
MMNAQNSSKHPETIKEALDQMFEEKPRQLNIQKLMDEIFLHEVEITPRMCLRPLMSRRPPVPRVERTADQQPRRRHSKPPGPGARKVKKILGRTYHQNEPSVFLLKFCENSRRRTELISRRCLPVAPIAPELRNLLIF